MNDDRPMNDDPPMHPTQPDVPDLELALRDLATALVVPATPDLASAVGVRLRGEVGLHRPDLARTTRRRPIVRSLWRSLAVAAALALLAVGAVLGVRHAMQLLEIGFGPGPTVAPSLAPSASDGRAPGTRLGLGPTVTLDDARDATDDPILVPTLLGSPDVVFLGDSRLRGQVALGYRPRPDLPAATTLDGLGLLVTQNAGSFDEGLAFKLLRAGLAEVEPVDVDGAPGYWITGEPHVFWYLAPDGSFIEESERRVGDTLAWERGGVLHRVEGAGSLGQALAIARSMTAD